MRRIDEASQMLAAWDRTVREQDAALRRRLEGATGGEAANIHSELGRLYLERRRLADALTEFETAVRLAPGQAAFHLLRAIALDALERTDAAGDAYHRAWTLEPSDPVKAYFALTRSQVTAAERDALRATFAATARDVVRGVRRTPRVAFFEVRFDIGASGDRPVFAPARYADGFAFVARGRYEDAIARWRDAAGHDPLVTDPALATKEMRDALAAFRQGNLAAALKSIAAASAAVPASSEAHRIRGVLLGLTGNKATSGQQFDAALRLHPDDERSWIALARTRDESVLPGDAVRTLEAAIRAVGNSAELRWRLAGSLVKAGRTADALDRYAEAARLGAISSQGQLDEAEARLASLELDLARTARARERRVRANLNDAAAHRDLGSVYAEQDRRDEALAELAIAAALDAGDPSTFVALGHSGLADGRDADAVDALEYAVRLAPDLREARYVLAQALTRVGRRDEGVQQLAEFDRLRTESIEHGKREDALAALKAEARRQSLAGQHRQAAQTWMKAAMSEPSDAQNFIEIAEALVKAGQLAASIDYFVKAADLNGVADVHLRLAEVLGRLGRSRESALARATYERLQLEDFRQANR